MKYILIISLFLLGTIKDQDIFKRYEFSEVLKTDENFGTNGVFDSACYRIQIHFNEITRRNDNPGIYDVTGADRLKGLITPFKGIITINSIKESDSDFYGNNQEGSKYIIVSATYKFEEKAEIRGSGIFSGKLDFSVHRLKNGALIDNLSDYMGDGYSNFVYYGMWQNYKTKKTKVCIWGDGRFTHFNGFDEGDGELVVNKKFIENGWKTDINGEFIDNPIHWWKIDRNVP